MYDLKGFRKEKKLTQGEVASLFSCGQNNISMQEKTNRDLTDEQIEILINRFDEDSVMKYYAKEAVEEADIPKVSFTEGVPYYNVDFIGGFDLVMNDQTINPEYLIDFKKYNDADYWCNVTGHSMEPEITHGDMIAMKKIEDFSFLPFGEVYAIVTTNGMRTIKRLGKGDDKEHYNLVPTNKSTEYSIQELPKRMISAIFQVLGCMKRL